MPYCPRCGNEVDPSDEYCSKCKYNLTDHPPINPVRRREDRNEKSGKHEEDNTGALMGGVIVVWLGVSFMLRNAGYIRWNQFGGVFILGVGIILLFRGLVEFSKTGELDPAFGFLVGGGFITLLGAVITFNLKDWWPVFLILIGILIILKGITERGRNPRSLKKK